MTGKQRSEKANVHFLWKWRGHLPSRNISRFPGLGLIRWSPFPKFSTLYSLIGPEWIPTTVVPKDPFWIEFRCRYGASTSSRGRWRPVSGIYCTGEPCSRNIPDGPHELHCTWGTTDEKNFSGSPQPSVGYYDVASVDQFHRFLSLKSQIDRLIR